MGGITFGDFLLQMPILGLDHLISRRPPEFELTWPTQLLTCHDLHARPFLEISVRVCHKSLGAPVTQCFFDPAQSRGHSDRSGPVTVPLGTAHQHQFLTEPALIETP
jgi:hypothetical protein